MLFHSSIRKELARGFGATLVALVTIVMTMMLIRTLSQAAKGAVNPSEVMMVLGAVQRRGNRVAGVAAQADQVSQGAEGGQRAGLPIDDDLERQFGPVGGAHTSISSVATDDAAGSRPTCRSASSTSAGAINQP